MKAVHAVISGQVQGVGFRWSCLQQARAVGAAGWVRNLPDGTVEVWVEGPDEVVEQMLAWCAEGPRWARVDQVHQQGMTPQGHGSFEVR